MTNPQDRQHRLILQRIARRVMVERGLEPDFRPAALAELEAIHAAAPKDSAATRDLRGLLWCSIDNDDSRDLDQLSVGEALAGGAVKLFVAVADVSALVRQGSALDGHAQKNTTSVYTAGGIFPMLPEKLSTNLTSLNFDAERVAVVVEMVLSADGTMTSSAVYQALVKNRAKLAYNSVAAWLDGKGPVPPALAAVPGLEANLRLQSRMTGILRAQRHKRGALSLQTTQARPVFSGDTLQDLVPDESNVAKNLIEDLMVAANGVAAKFLAAKNLPSMRRVVRTPIHWDRMVELAAAHGGTLPKDPDGPALEQFLLAARDKDPAYFPDLSLAIIKLMGRGEYVIEFPGGEAPGHFGLAVRDYAHSTAPNRRFPDLILQRLLKAAISGAKPPYGNDELVALAKHCTDQEDAAKKVERQVVKSAGALLLANRIGEKFWATVTGVTEGGVCVWVRLAHPPIEGRLCTGTDGLQVGDRLRVQLMSTDVERGYIDFNATK